MLDADKFTVTVIDGVTNTTTTVAIESIPVWAVNPLTNKTYGANNGSTTVTVMDRSADTTVRVGADPAAMVVNPAMNKAYVANVYDGAVTVIDRFANHYRAPGCQPRFGGRESAHEQDLRGYQRQHHREGVTRAPR